MNKEKKRNFKNKYLEIILTIAQKIDFNETTIYT